METTIYLKIRYTILGIISFGKEIDLFQFIIPTNESSVIKVDILPKDNEIVVQHEKKISNKVFEFLQSGDLNIPTSLHAEFSTIKSDESSSARQVLTYIKYYLGYIELQEQLMSHKDAYWSTDGLEWKPLPGLGRVFIDSHGVHTLNKESATAIQYLIDHKIEPLMALRHLHKARNETIPHYKWIDATIAAELAIKEFLIRLKPEIAVLLLEIPSPPLSKLYGTVLESLGLERSPKLKELSKGVEIRNRLVHRPETMNIDLDEANKYVHDVEIAIHHLMFLLYRDEANVKLFLRVESISGLSS